MDESRICYIELSKAEAEKYISPINVYIYIYIYMCVCVCVCIYIYIYIYIYNLEKVVLMNLFVGKKLETQI